MGGTAFSHLVGRDDEAERILELLGSTARLPYVAAVVGDAGVGKTALWSAGAQAAEACGYRVLACRPSEAETHFSYAGVVDLFRDVVAAHLPDLPPVQGRALETVLLLGEAGPPADPHAVSAAVLSVLGRLSERSPVLLAVDDLQWLDDASMVTLRYALPRLRQERVAILVAARGALPEWLRRGTAADRLVLIELGPLSLGAIHELLRAELGTSFPRPALRRIQEASGGNALFALELARSLERRGGEIDPDAWPPLPVGLDALVAERLDGLSPTALAVAQVVAALADPAAGLIDAASGADADAGIGELLVHRVLEVDGDRLRFTHPLLAACIAGRTPPRRRRAVHARLADLAPTREERARHLALAVMEPDRDIAGVIEEAALTTRRRGACAAAASLMDHALRLTPAEDVTDRVRRTLSAAEAHAEAGDGARAIVMLEGALGDTEAGPSRARVLARLASCEERFGDQGVGVRRMKAALEQARGNDELEATIHLLLADLWRVTPDMHVGLEHAENAVSAARRVGNDALTCRALAVYGLLHFMLGKGTPVEEMQEALRLERSLPEWPLADGAARVVAHQLVMAGDAERGRKHLDEWRRALAARDDPAEAEALWYLSQLELRAGNWDLAGRFAADSLALRAQFGHVGAQGPAELPAAAVAAHRGEIEKARAISEHAMAVADATGVQVAQSGHRWVLGFIELSLGNPLRALEYLRRGWEIRDEICILEPGHRRELADTLEALIAIGELDEAENRIATWEERSRVLDRAWALAILARCTGLLRAARGDAAGAMVAFDEALREHARVQDPFQLARTLLALGVTERRSKQRAAARTTLVRALEIFVSLGAPLWADKARAELARISGRAPSDGGLTVGERRIVELVADGHTNREVAAALFLTTRTVETVLSRAYRKLGVHSRSELAVLLAAGKNNPSNS